MIVRHLAANVRRVARERGIPIGHVADFAGLGRTTMFQLLRGDCPSDPRLSTVVALANALEVPVGELLRAPDHEPLLAANRSAPRGGAHS